MDRKRIKARRKKVPAKRKKVPAKRKKSQTEGYTDLFRNLAKGKARKKVKRRRTFTPSVLSDDVPLRDKPVHLGREIEETIKELDVLRHQRAMIRVRVLAMPSSRRKSYLRAMAGRSRVASVKAFCYMCVGWGPRIEILDCTDCACPLYPWRPFAKR